MNNLIYVYNVFRLKFYGTVPKFYDICMYNIYIKTYINLQFSTTSISLVIIK